MKRLFCGAAALLSMTAAVSAEDPALPADAVAKVGSEVITFSELNTTLNSSPVVGLSIPALGTRERNTVMLTLLDRAISVNLLYLAALKHGKDQDPVYQQDLKHFSDGLLSALYRERAVGALNVSAEEIQSYYKTNIVPGTALTDEIKAGIEATLRKEKFKTQIANMRARLRQGVAVKINEKNLAPEDDQVRMDSEEVARAGERVYRWSEVKDLLTTPNHSQSVADRAATLNQMIDEELMARKGQEAGLDQDPVYRARLAEFRKTRLVTLYRDELTREKEPSAQEIKDYYAKHKDQIQFKEHRHIQMIVLRTKEQAEQVKSKIDKGETTFEAAAAQYSIHPGAKKNLGDFGWVAKGTGFPALDKLTFSLESKKLGGPVQTPSGWHLVKVLDLRNARFDDINDEDTRKATRRLLLKARLDNYAVSLRKNEFPVVVYQDTLKRLFRDEASWIARLTKEAEAHPERTQKALEQMQQHAKAPLASPETPPESAKPPLNSSPAGARP